MKRKPKLPQWPPRFPGLLTWFHWRYLTRGVLVLFTVLILTALVFTHLDVYQVDAGMAQIRAGQPAPVDIIAPRDLTWNETPAASRGLLTRPAPETHASRYDTEALVLAKRDLKVVIDSARAEPLDADTRTLLAEQGIDDAVITALRAMDDGTLAQTHLTTLELLDEVMAAQLEPETGVERARLQLIVLAEERVEADRVAVVRALASAVLRPTWVPMTPRAEVDTHESTPPPTIQFRKGEVIIHKGDLVSREAIAQLQRFEVLAPLSLTRAIPLAIIMAFSVIMLGIYLRTFCPLIYRNDRQLMLLVTLILASMWAMTTLGIGQNATLVGLIALPAGAMAIAGLLGTAAAFAPAVLMAVIAGFTVDYQFSFTVLVLGSSLAGLAVVSSIWPASRIVPAFLSLVIVNLLLLVAVFWVNPDHGLPLVWKDLGTLSLWAVFGALAATTLAIGAIYLLARPFGITTHYRLMELATNQHEPLLRRMMAEAPGSYHSSVMVANMAEAAADAIGADALLTRVAALYHDIGKLKRPAFFVENQAPLGIDNVHQRLLPKLSYLILTSHVRDGVETARECRLPNEVVTIIREHHGTTLAAFFYHRALSQADGETVSEHDFRYPGPKPSTRESAVVMLADSVQASVKSLKEPVPSRIEDMVREVVQSRLDDGQFDDCDITLRDITRITDVFIRILTGLYTYSRIEYPDIKRGTRGHSYPERIPPAGESTSAAAGN